MSTELRGLLARVVALLDAAGVPFMIAGSFASTAHGMPRTTQGLDLLIDAPSPAALDAPLRSMEPEQYYVDADAARDALARRSMFNVIDLHLRARRSTQSSTRSSVSGSSAAKLSSN